MKSVLKISILAAAIFAVGCQSEEKVENNATALTTLSTADEKASYAIGASLAKYLKANIDQQKEVGVELDSAIVLQGVQDTFAEKEMLLTDAEAQTVLQELDQRITSLMQKKAEDDAQAAKKAGDEYRANFGKMEGVATTQSGLMYQVDTMGEGKKPAAQDTVVVHYKGTLTDGTTFDSSYDRNQPATFPLDRVIPGWTEGVQLMPVGSKFIFVIPPELAYGDQNTPSIPANSTLVFEVELLEIQEPAKVAEATQSNG